MKNTEPESCTTRTGRFTGQVICTACAPGCEHYICTHEDETVSPDTRKESP